MDTFHGHTRPGDFGQTVNVVGFDVAAGLDAFPHVFRPRFGPEHADAQRQFLQVHPHFGGAVNQVQKIAGCATDDGDAEILHEHDLAVGVAAGDRE